MKTLEELNIKRYGVAKPNKFDILSMCWIIGVIDSNGVAHSKSFYYEDAKNHEDYYPLIRDKRWRWDFDKCINLSVYRDCFEVGDGDIIRNHLRREYGIRFYSNGFHDIEYLCSKMSDESHLK